jgi:hypothetical protein
MAPQAKKKKVNAKLNYLAIFIPSGVVDIVCPSPSSLPPNDFQSHQYFIPNVCSILSVSPAGTCACCVLNHLRKVKFLRKKAIMVIYNTSTIPSTTLESLCISNVIRGQGENEKIRISYSSRFRCHISSAVNVIYRRNYFLNSLKVNTGLILPRYLQVTTETMGSYFIWFSALFNPETLETYSIFCLWLNQYRNLIKRSLNNVNRSKMDEWNLNWIWRFFLGRKVAESCFINI